MSACGESFQAIRGSSSAARGALCGLRRGTTSQVWPPLAVFAATESVDGRAE